MGWGGVGWGGVGWGGVGGGGGWVGVWWGVGGVGGWVGGWGGVGLTLRLIRNLGAVNLASAEGRSRPDGWAPLRRGSHPHGGALAPPTTHHPPPTTHHPPPTHHPHTLLGSKMPFLGHVDVIPRRFQCMLSLLQDLLL